ncbi:UPF0481 protein isoform X3 [Gossypium australe]|uniref:UPF0481 protein isoform X3 n=1 Tax=Gossypium australe TaxID=47621 RepID=A0A5B6WXY5_9ROSI|nr:UPF0481 protein isoform X3 [Gossypium australe]
MLSTTKLEDGGICFLSVPIQNMQIQEQGKENMFDITFDNDTDELNIPILKVIGDSIEPTLRNYMAYKQLFSWEGPNFFVDYVVFIDKLINTSKDMNGIINNFLENDEAVTQIFNKLRESIYYSPKDFYYKDIADQVNKDCNRK